MFVIHTILIIYILPIKNTMSTLQLRPRFKKTIDLTPNQITERIQTYRSNPLRRCDVTLYGNHTVFFISSKEQQYWSPQLSLEILEEEQGSLLKGLYGPAPKVWTMFMFLYTGIGFIGLVGLMYGLVQWSLNMSATALWIFPAAVLLELILYLIARSGQKIAAKQIELLQQELNKIIPNKF